jgi:two-component system response regulator RegX3
MKDSYRPPRALVLEDDATHRDAIALGLRREGFDVRAVATGAEAIEALEESHYDIALVDLMLPGMMSGLDFCREALRRWDIPIIVVTAKDSEADSVAALELGAEDYVRKPFRMRELVARMRVVLRRRKALTDRSPTAGTRTPSSASSDGILEAGDLVLDLDGHTASLGAKPIHLTPKEFELLSLLVAARGKVLTRQQLIDEVWGYDYVGDTKTLDVHIKRLRSKIEPDPAKPQRILTVRGVGYKFVG